MVEHLLRRAIDGERARGGRNVVMNEMVGPTLLYAWL